MINRQLMRSSTFFILILATTLLYSCSIDSKVKEPINSSPTLPTRCKQMAPVKDIWKLEPMLVKNGKIKDKMNKAEKEKIIRQYIRNKNEPYKTCLKSRK